MSGIAVERDGRGVVTLTLSNPGRLNALSDAMIEGLCREMAALRDDPDCRIVVLRGEGGVFCAGRDLHDLARIQEAPPETVSRMYDLLEEMNRSIYGAPVPVLAVVERHALGIGTMIASWADISIAEEGASFGYPEVRYGIVPYGAVPTMLNTLSQRAMLDLILTGRRIDGREAAARGIVSRAVPRAALEAVVTETIDDLLAGDAPALAGIKAFVRECEALSYPDAIGLATARAKAGTGRGNASAGIGGFLNRRGAD